MDSLCCELAGVIPEKICCLEPHRAIHREFLLGGAKCLFYGISHYKKNSRGTRQSTAASSRTQQIPHWEVLVEESAGSLELSLPALSSYQYVHGNFNRETLEVSERGLRGSARGAKLEKQKNDRGDKKTRGFRFLRP